jgi:hypothetical protein
MLLHICLITKVAPFFFFLFLITKLIKHKIKNKKQANQLLEEKKLRHCITFINLNHLLV